MTESFINPYTFVELRTSGENKGKSRNTVDPNGKKLYGKIECELFTRTQLSIPDISNEKDENGINKHPFFRVDGNAVIPGSSLRGVVRNVYEALTNSCMHINDKDDDYFSARQNKLSAGLLAFENGYYKLYAAKRRRVMDKDSLLKDLKTGDRVSYQKIQKTDRSLYDIAESLKKDPNGDGIYLCVDTFGKPPKQNHPSVFEKNNQKSVINADTIKAFKVNIDRYEPKNNKNSGKQYSECFKRMERGEALLPVWYYFSNGNYYMAPSQFSRTVFIKKPKNIIKDMSYQSCSKKSEMCEACALFGMVGQNKDTEAVAGNVRFGDAVCTDSDCFDNYYVLPVLGSPRLSSFEFYLSGNELFPDPDKKGTVIAGRKFYWHHKNKIINTDDEKAVAIAEKARKEGKDSFSSSDNCHELVKPGFRFSFDIYFDGVTDEQLKKLVYSLNFGENSEESPLCHKIGHGKPIGLGSVKIVVDKVTVREFSDDKYQLIDVTEDYLKTDKNELFDKHEYDQVLKAVNINTISDCRYISYPHNDQCEDVFKWFADNRDVMRSGEGMPKAKKRLPKLNDNNQLIPCKVKTDKPAGYKSHNNGGKYRGK